MTYVFRTKYVAFVAALVIGVSDVYADRCATEAPACEEFCVVSPDCNCNDTCCGNFWVNGDLLCLRACVDGFGCDFGTTEINTTVSAGKVITDILESDDEIRFDWDLGFRLGGGYNFGCSCWDAAISWTHLNEKGKGCKDHNRAHWKLRFNEVDGAMGYNFKCYDCFNFRPFLGVRYARIDQHLHTHLETTIAVIATGASSIAVSTKHDHEKFWGAGPLVGFEADWCIGCGLSVYGNLSGNFLYGEFKNRFNDSDVFTAAISNCNAHSKSCTVLKGFDAGVGLRYEMCYATLQLGLEHHSYLDYNQIGCGGDFNLYGANASVIVRF